jgi:hypothetical protein
MEDLLFEYKRTLKETKKWYKQLEEADETVLTSAAVYRSSYAGLPAFFKPFDDIFHICNDRSDDFFIFQ